MCGRYTITSPLDLIIHEFGITNNINFPASYNAAPSQQLPVIIGSELKLLQWGYLPEWAKEDTKPQINARSETAYEKPTFREGFSNRRCLVPANGFYEWTKIKGGKKPYYITNNKLMAFAGIYNGNTYCLLTREAEGCAKEIHSRMPVIIPADYYTSWIDTDTKGAIELINDIKPPTLEAFAVSDMVNTPKNNDETLIERNELF